MADTDTETDANTDFDPASVADRPYYPSTPPSPLTQIVQGAQRPQRFADLGQTSQGPDQVERPQEPLRTVRPIPQPPLSRDIIPQHFIPTAKRPIGQIGDVGWAVRAAREGNTGILDSSYMPNQQQGYGVIGGAGRQLAAWGDPAVAPFARLASSLANTLGSIFDFYSGGAFSRSYNRVSAKRMAAMREQFDMQHEQMLYNAQMAFQISEQKLQPYKDILGMWRSHAFAKDEDANNRAAEEAIRRLAVADPVMSMAINNGGLKGALEQIHQRDAKAHDMLAAAVGIDTAVKARKKKAGESTDDDGEGGDQWTTGGHDEHGLPGPMPDPAAPKPEEITAATPPKDQSDYDEKVLKKAYPALKPDSLEEIHKMYRENREAKPELAKKEYSRATLDAARNRLGKDISDTAEGPGTTEEKLNKIAAMDGVTAGQIKSLHDLSADPADYKAAGRNHVIDLAVATSNGKWKQDQYANKRDFLKDVRNRTMQERINSVPTDASNILEILDRFNFSETENIPIRWLEAKKQLVLTGNDPRFIELFTAIQSYINKYAAIESGFGQARMTQLKFYMSHFKEFLTNSQIRGAVKIDMKNIEQDKRSLDEVWRSRTGIDSEAPGWIPLASATRRAIAHHDEITGEFPEGSPPALERINKHPKDREKHPPPMSMKDISDMEEMEDWLARNPNDPRAKETRELLLKKYQGY